MSGVAIRDAICTRLANFNGYKPPRKVMTPQLQPDALPSLSVVVVSRSMTPDGEANVGEPRFVSSTVIGLSFVRGFADTATLDGQIDSDVEAALSAILTDPDFVHFGPGALFESVSGITARRLYPREGETYFCEARVEITFEHRVSFEPNIPDHYKGNTITARPLQSPGAPTVTIKTDEADWL